MNALDKKLIETECIRNGNWVKLIALLKHQFNEWSMSRLSREGYADFKVVYMPVLMNITPEGINNNELACQARVTKQAMSKVAKELQKLDKGNVIISEDEVILAKAKEKGIDCGLYVKVIDQETLNKAWKNGINYNYLIINNNNLRTYQQQNLHLMKQYH